MRGQVESDGQKYFERPPAIYSLFCWFEIETERKMGKKNKNKKNVSSKNKNVKKVEKPPEKPEEHKSSSPTDDNEPTSFSSLRIDEEPSEAPRTSLLREMIYTYCSLVLFYKFLSLHRTSENLKALQAKVVRSIRNFNETIIYEVLF